jgi:hypothetical protein
MPVLIISFRLLLVVFCCSVTAAELRSDQRAHSYPLELTNLPAVTQKNYLLESLCTS